MRYQIDNTTVDTDEAWQSWGEGIRYYGPSAVSLATGFPTMHEQLHRTRENKYYTLSWTDWLGASPRSAKWISEEGAADWLLANGHEVPESIKAALEES